MTQTQQMVSLFEKGKDTQKADAKKASKQYLFSIAKDAPLQTAFMDTRKGSLWDAVYSAVRESANKKISVCLPSGAKVEITSEEMQTGGAPFFGTLYDAMKQEDTKDIQDTIEKRRQIRFMLYFVQL
jgi:hypothetical protein